MENKYLHKPIEEIAAEESFIAWVKAGKPKEKVWYGWVQTDQDFAKKVDAAAALINSLVFKENVPAIDTKVLWKKIEESTAKEQPGAKTIPISRRRTIRILVASVAAVIALFVIFYPFGDGDQFNTGNAEELVVNLPDASTIQLNAASEIEFNEKTWKEIRSVRLNGEAFFSVEKGSDFTVKTDYGEVKVLGTTFNVYSREDGFRVHCTSGRVQVSTKNQTQILEPGMACQLKDNGDLEQVENVPSEVEWMDQVYRFENTPLSAVFDEMARQFDVKITYDQEIGEMLYDGLFEKGDLDKAIESVCWPMQLKANKNERKLVIEKNE